MNQNPLMYYDANGLWSSAFLGDPRPLDPEDVCSLDCMAIYHPICIGFGFGVGQVGGVMVGATMAGLGAPVATVITVVGVAVTVYKAVGTVACSIEKKDVCKKFCKEKYEDGKCG